MLNLTTVAPLLQKPGIYGPVTATLDWCEVRNTVPLLEISLLTPPQLNHQFSPYIAEMANTFSNCFTVALALLGLREVKREALPVRYALGYWVWAHPVFSSCPDTSDF